MVNISVSAINNSLDTLTLNEIISIEGMNQDKRYFHLFKNQINIDIESIRQK